MPFMSDKSIMTPSSIVARPATLCPPPRTATSRCKFLASFTASMTSPTPRQRATTAGCLSMSPLCTRRTSSYPASDGWSSCPLNEGANSLSAAPIDINRLRIPETAPWRPYLRDLLEMRADDVGPDLVAGFRHVLPVRDEQVRARQLVGSEHRLFHADVRDVFVSCGNTA